MSDPLLDCFLTACTTLIDQSASEMPENDSEIGQAIIGQAILELSQGVSACSLNPSDALNTQKPGYSGRYNRTRVDLRHASDAQIKNWTRFTKDDIIRLTRVLKFPPSIRTKSRRSFTAFESLVILLSRLAYPTRLDDLGARFGMSASGISECVNITATFLFDKWAIPLLCFNKDYLTPAQLDRFASAIAARGCPMPNVWGFMDATIKGICRPGWQQRDLYSGYFRGHCLKYQGAVTPDGILRCCSFPIAGRRADGACLRLSGLEPLLEKYATGLDGQRLFVWGDPAYANTEVVASAEKEVGRLSKTEQTFYSEMAKYRQCIEWSFGKISNLFAFNNYTPALHLHLSPVGAYFMVSVLFTNAHTCIYGSETSCFYCLSPPNLEDYFRLPVSSEGVDFSLSKTFEYEDTDV